MTCEHVLELAIAFLEGTLSAEARAEVVVHLAGCGDCRGLIAALRTAPPEDRQLTSMILERTSGPVCDGVRDRLGDWVDAGLDPAEAGLVGGHLARCPECAALTRALAALRAELPGLAEVDHDPGFVREVLARTSERQQAVPHFERWLASFRHLLDRPRIALEGGFVAAMFLVLPLGTLRHDSRTAPAVAIGAVREASGATSAHLSILARSAWGTTRGFVADRAATVAAAIERAAGPPGDPRETRSGTFSPPGASSPTSGTTEERRR